MGDDEISRRVFLAVPLGFALGCSVLDGSDGMTSINPGFGSGKVVTGPGFLGNGTAASPLNFDPSVSLGPGPEGYWTTLFQQRFSSSPLNISTYLNDFADRNKTLLGTTGGAQGFAASGTGAAVSYVASASGGVVAMQGPTSGAGFCDWTVGNAPLIGNVRLQNWLIAMRVACGHAPNSSSNVSLGLVVGGSTQAGLGYAGAPGTGNWQYTRGVTPANISDSGVTIDFTGTQYKWMYLLSDGANIRYCADILGGAAEKVAEPVSNLPNSSGTIYFFNEGSGASDLINLDCVVVCVGRS